MLVTMWRHSETGISTSTLHKELLLSGEVKDASVLQSSNPVSGHAPQRNTGLCTVGLD